ncbi:MAG: peptide chain release factor 1 [Planctomycetota bacterium]|nr:peptide chain release factor 1 [Planctomycetota bacterium]
MSDSPDDILWNAVLARLERRRKLERDIASMRPGSPEYVAALREFGRLSKLAAACEEYQRIAGELEEARKLVAGSDPDLKSLAAEEIPALEAALSGKRDALFRMADDEETGADRNVILEIRAGVGGEEAALWARDLYEMYRKYIERKGWTYEVLSTSEAEQGGFKEIIFMVRGEGAYGRLRLEGGGHRVQRVPKTEAQGRIHTSMATVAAMPEAEEVDVRIDPKDLEIKAVAAGGPGGQNVNKVATQIQILHIPTGIQVRCMETRSQQQNRERAMSLLRARILEIEQAKKEGAERAARLEQIKSGDRSDRIRTYNFPQNRVTDHRLEGEEKNYPLQQVLDGDLDPILDRLEAQARLRRMARSSG